jgi:4-hydroxy-3-polyprenylbenzoate decarboxylase
MEEPDPVKISASGSKPGIDATKRIPGEGFKRPWPPLIKMDP